jgi:hypothetical protein
MGKDRVSYFYHPTTVRCVAPQIHWMLCNVVKLPHTLENETVDLYDKDERTSCDYIT